MNLDDARAQSEHLLVSDKRSSYCSPVPVYSYLHLLSPGHRRLRDTVSGLRSATESSSSAIQGIGVMVWVPNPSSGSGSLCPAVISCGKLPAAPVLLRALARRQITSDSAMALPTPLESPATPCDLLRYFSHRAAPCDLPLRRPGARLEAAAQCPRLHV